MNRQFFFYPFPLIRGGQRLAPSISVILVPFGIQFRARTCACKCIILLEAPGHKFEDA